RFVWSCRILGLGWAGWLGLGVTGFGVMSRSFGDLSFLTECPTVTCPLPFPFPLFDCCAAIAVPLVEPLEAAVARPAPTKRRTSAPASSTIRLLPIHVVRSFTPPALLSGREPLAAS